jgi:hypothetical protein
VRIVSSIRPSAPGGRDFIAAFKAKYNQDPTHLHAHAYDQII